MTYEIKRFPHAGTIDADGHILEPPDLWENYLEAAYRPRALRIGVDAEGYEYLEIDQRPSQRSRRGSLGILGAMGEEDLKPSPERRYADNMPFGSADPQERLSLMTQENLDCTLLYPTIGLLWECEVTDAELTLALALFVDAELALSLALNILCFVCKGRSGYHQRQAANSTQ